MMASWVDWINGHAESILRFAILLLGGIPLIKLCELLARRVATPRLTAQGAMLVEKAIRYGGILLLVIMLLSELGFNLNAILGAAGIAGVAIGFASQTSLSNLISGIFLIAEKPFQVGDAIQINDTMGIVHSIDLLSVKLRTFDNKFVRLPNESLVKSQLTNITRFPIRRFDINVGVSYNDDIDHVTRVLADIADKNPYSLDEPPPVIIFKGFGDSSLDFMLGVWFEKSDMMNLRSSIMKEIKRRFDEEGIEIPFPHRTLYAGSATQPFPVQIVENAMPANKAAATHPVESHT